MIADGNPVGCLCTCDFPCWQREGIAPPCESCGCSVPDSVGRLADVDRQRVESVRARLVRSSPSPWSITFPRNDVLRDWPQVVDAQGRDVTGVPDGRDAAFIASAPEDVAFLLALVDRAYR